MAKISIFYSEPPRKRNMFSFLREVPMWAWVIFAVAFVAGLVFDYLL